MPKAISAAFNRPHVIRAAGPGSKAPNKGSSRGEQTAGGGTGKTLLYNTRLGQHILKNPGIAQAIVDKAHLLPTDVVVEVGPGTGNLTAKILAAAKHVTAIEMDPRMVAELQKRFLGQPEQHKIDYIIGDFVKATIPRFDVMISNTPYQISSPLVMKILAHRPLFRKAVLMFQLEFCQRLVARPGNEHWSRLSANVQMYAKVHMLMKVGKGNFDPPPEVESGVVAIEPLDPPPPVRFEEFDGLTRILFSRSNRMCRACFHAKGVYELLDSNYKVWYQEHGESQGVDLDMTPMKERVDRLLEETGYAEQRAGKMDIDDFLALLLAFHKIGIHFTS